ncbi:hypothetical protein INR76_00200 [Marixanthomonas sp. SCSIO 43207]|uniref:hypothetical protein n=1 Tax=Marixanthomonas sp. SCSIO 43207 TaxID=2779360 RepID=UPI001CA842A7|nr:hypothetical protein [Marixanthomonas sp. SCSIO 43207]UAB81212.1 hypothetical protein INR76_00200 [Marixanthomonas sp. SCSIO 43207]
MVVLDLFYTYVYNTGSYRNKVMWMRDMESVSLDYAVFGNSRANYSINPDIIYDKTGKEGLNFGINASGPFEVYLTIKEFLKKHSTERIFVQVDYTFYQTTPDDVGQLSWIPYLKEKQIIQEFKKSEPHYTYLYYVPFYRYLKYDSRVGFRNMALSFIRKPPNFLNNRGYLEREGNLKNDEYYEYTLQAKSNPYINKITELCKNNNIDIVYFTAPIYKPSETFSALENNLSNYYDLSESINKKKYFSDHTHLNTAGAMLFTNKFIEMFYSRSPVN